MFHRIAAVLCCLMLAGCSSGPKAEPAPASSRSYAFWPQYPDDPRIQFVASYSSSEDVAPAKTTGLEKVVFGREATPEAEISKPYGVAMRDGKIYVCDMRSNALAVLDLKKKQTRIVGITGFNRLEHPVAVAVADDGEIFVADNGRGAILVFDASERYSRVLAIERFKPAAVAVHGERVYASDITSQLVHIFDRRTGKPLGTIGSIGDEDGQFRLPLGVATDRAGNVYVVDMMRCRVQKFSPDGKLISAMGQLGDYAGSFARPKHIAVDADGVVYVVDAAFQNVQMFNAENQLLMHFGAPGAFPGAMNLPAGVAVCEDCTGVLADRLHPGFEAKRLVIVSNQFGPAKVSVYAMGAPRRGFTAQDLAAAAVPVESGVGAPSAERLKLQAPGGEEPPPEPGAGPSKPADAPASGRPGVPR